MQFRGDKVDDSQKRKEAHNLLSGYRRLRRIRANDELNKINKAVSRLSKIDKLIIKRKYLHVEEYSNIRIYIDIHMSESTFYRKLNIALLNFHETYFN